MILTHRAAPPTHITHLCNHLHSSFVCDRAIIEAISDLSTELLHSCFKQLSLSVGL